MNESSPPEVVAIVPSLGRSPVIEECLAALRRQTPRPRIVLVQQGDPPAEAVAARVDEVMQLAANVGFAAANNLAIDATTEPWVLTVNDDAVLADDWLEQVFDVAAAAGPRRTVQGANVDLHDPERIDGCGLQWNRWWQAVQIHTGEQANGLPAAPFEIAGASATAALYRRSALEDSRLPTGDVFDSTFESYYEDVDLALRLAALDVVAVCVPAARARHLGSATGKTLGRRKARLVYRNRLLTLLRVAGPGFFRLLPRVVARDLADAVRTPGLAPSIGAAWAAAARRAPKALLAGGSSRQLRRLTRQPTRAEGLP